MVVLNYSSADVLLLISSTSVDWKVYGCIKLPLCGCTLVSE